MDGLSLSTKRIIRTDEIIAQGKRAVTKLGDSAFTMSYDFIGADNALCAQAQTIHVLIDRRNGKPVPIPPDLRAKLAIYYSES